MDVYGLLNLICTKTQVCGFMGGYVPTSWPEAVTYWSLVVTVRLPGNEQRLQQVTVWIKQTK